MSTSHFPSAADLKRERADKLTGYEAEGEVLDNDVDSLVTWERDTTFGAVTESMQETYPETPQPSPAEEVVEVVEVEVGEDIGELASLPVEGNLNPFQPTAKMVMSRNEQAQATLDRIKELEVGVFKDEVLLWETVNVSPDAATEAAYEQRIEQGNAHIAALAVMYNHHYGA